MDTRTRTMIGLEIVWWLLTAVVVAAVLYPIQRSVYQFAYRWENAFFVVSLVTFARYTFLWEYAPWARRQYLKAGLMVVGAVALLYLIRHLNFFMTYMDENGWEPVTGHLPMDDDRLWLETYIWREMLFFGVGGALAALFFIVRMIISVYRTHNTPGAV